MSEQVRNIENLEAGIVKNEGTRVLEAVPDTTPEVESNLWDRCVIIMLCIFCVIFAIGLSITLYIFFTDDAASVDAKYGCMLGSVFLSMILACLCVITCFKWRNFNVCSPCPGPSASHLESARNEATHEEIALIERRSRTEHQQKDAGKGISLSSKETEDLEVEEKVKTDNTCGSNLPKDSTAVQSTSREKKGIIEASVANGTCAVCKISKVASDVTSILAETLVRNQSKVAATPESSPVLRSSGSVDVSCTNGKNGSDSELSSGEIRRRKLLNAELCPLTSSDEDPTKKE